MNLSGTGRPAPVHRRPAGKLRNRVPPLAAAARLVLMLVVGAAAAAPPGEAALEERIVSAINELRTEPGHWAEWLAGRQGMYRGDVLRRPQGPAVKTSEGVAALEEAVSELRGIEPRAPLGRDAVLDAVAREHVAAAGPAGRVGHVATDGMTLTQRLHRHGVEREEVAEAVTYGPAQAREVVAALVVDDGVAGRPHRDMLLDPGYVDLGVACGPHARHGTMCVVLLATRERPVNANGRAAAPRNGHSPGN